MVRLLLTLLLVSMQAHATEQSTCAKVEGARPYGYCVSFDPESPNQDVLYLFHGAGGEGSGAWQTSGTLLRLKEAFRAAQHPLPRVIEVSFGGLWLLTPQTKNLKSGLLDFFIATVMPELEAKLPSPAAKRKILGFSMGGLNGAILALARPDLFTAAALVSPALVGVSPFISREAQTEYERSRGWPAGAADRLLAAVRAYVDSEEEWANLSPSVTALKLAGPGRTDFYVSAGTKDTYFYEEGRLFAQSLGKAGAFTIWHELPEADHNASDASALARFLTLPF